MRGSLGWTEREGTYSVNLLWIPASHTILESKTGRGYELQVEIYTGFVMAEVKFVEVDEAQACQEKAMGRRS